MSKYLSAFAVLFISFTGISHASVSPIMDVELRGSCFFGLTYHHGMHNVVEDLGEGDRVFLNAEAYVYVLKSGGNVKHFVRGIHCDSEQASASDSLNSYSYVHFRHSIDSKTNLIMKGLVCLCSGGTVLSLVSEDKKQFSGETFYLDMSYTPQYLEALQK